MKDFAKSIKIGNAFSKGQVLGESDGKKYVYGGEVNGTYIVHRQPDGKTYSFSSEQEIKDWMRNSKISNSKVGNSNKIYQDSNVTIYDDGIVELDYFRGYTQYAKDVESIVRDEIRGLEKQISDLKKAADKVKEIGRKYKLL